MGKNVLAVLLLAGVVALAYAPALDAGFTQDDHDLVERGAAVGKAGWGEIFSSPYWARTALPDRTLYRPVTIASFSLERRAGLGVRGHHAANLALHFATSALLFFYARRIGATLVGAISAAGLFAVHPVHVSAVANLVGRAEILAALFVLGALLAGSATSPWPGDAASPRPASRRAAAWTAAACVFLALGSKEIAIVAIPLLLAQDILFRPLRPRSGREAWIERAAVLAPAVLAAVAFVVLRTAAIEDFPGLQQVRAMDDPTRGLSGEARAATVLAIAARYGALLLYPAPLCPDYSAGAIPAEASLLAPRPVAGALLLAGSVLLALAPALSRWRRAVPGGARAVSIAAALFLLPYLVVGNVLVRSGAGFAERLLYLPSAGACLLAGLLLGRVDAALRAPRGRYGAWTAAVVPAAVAATIVAAAFPARAGCRAWKDDESLFRRACAECPPSARSRYVLATLLEKEGKTAEALREYDLVLRLFPEHFASWTDKGRLLAARGDLEGAERALREAIRAHPMYGESRMLLGMTLSREGRLDEAERQLRRALLLDGTLVAAGAELGHVLYRSGRYAEAADLYARCVAAGRRDLERNLTEARARASGAAGSR